MLLLIGQCLILFLTLLSQNYTNHVGRKSTFRILNRGSAKALDKVVELDGIVYFMVKLGMSVHCLLAPLDHL
jgi:hypothetical protein